MQIVLIASGTRGDVQPMLALGGALRDRGHAVRLLAGANFADWVAAHGLDLYPTFDMEALMGSALGIQWAEGANPRAQLQTMKTVLEQMREQVIADMQAATADADLLVTGFVSEPFALAIAERYGMPLVTAALQPYRATASGPASLVPLVPRGNSPLNRWMGRFAQRLSWGVAADVANDLRARLGLPAMTAAGFVRATAQVPALYAFSPAVVPPVADANAVTTGYWLLPEPEPAPALRRFVAAGEPPVYLGFGSMPTSDPARSIGMMVEALRRVGRRGVIGRGWSGAGAAELPDTVFLADHAPHRWLFGHMAAVVHHGGAGTTAAGLFAGKPTLVVPHLGDQPYWGRRVHELGVGPKPLPRPKLTVDTLTARLDALLADPLPAHNAAVLGARIRAEDGVARAVEWLDRFMAGRR